MTVENLYEKSLHSMANKTIRYNLCETSDGDINHYEVQICENSPKINREETIESISPDKKFVCELIEYLCENVIDTAHFNDIVQDYIWMREEKW